MVGKPKSFKATDAKPADDRETVGRSDMAKHLRVLADALDNPDLLTIPVDWASIEKRIAEVKSQLE
jgi:hypothetical protein